MNTVYQSKEWKEAEQFELTDDFMISFFQKDAYGVIYVVNHERSLCGTVTLSNFRRYFLQKEELIQTAFVSISETEGEDQLQEIFQNNNIFAVPLLDRKGHIVKEYRKKFERESSIDNDGLFKLYRHFLSSDLHVRRLVITRFENGQQRNIALKIKLQTKGRLVIIDEDDIIDLYHYIKKEDYQFIYDCVPRHLRVREITYIKLGVKYLFIHCQETSDRKEISGAKKQIPASILRGGGGRLAICQICW